MNCRLYLRLFLFVVPALNVLPGMLFCTLSFYKFFYFLKGGRTSRSNKVAAAPERSISPKIVLDMFRVSLADLSCYLCLQCADEPGRCDIRRHGYQQVHMVPVGFSGQHLPAEAAAQITGVIDHEVTDLIRDHRTQSIVGLIEKVQKQWRQNTVNNAKNKQNIRLLYNRKYDIIWMDQKIGSNCN